MTSTGSTLLRPAPLAESDFDVLGSVGLRASAAPWAARALTPSARAFISRRWNPEVEVFEWLPTDKVSMAKAARSRSVNLAGVRPGVQLEFLICAAWERDQGLSGMPPATRRLADAARNSDPKSIMHLDRRGLAELPETLLRRWQKRLALMMADPDREWDRDEIRQAVVKPSARQGNVFNVGQVSQPWLRSLLVDVLKVRIDDLADGTPAKWVTAVIQLSRVLATRTDGGKKPESMTAAVMDSVVHTLKNQPGMNDALLSMILKDFSAVLRTAALRGYYDRVRLPASFAVRREHYPKRVKVPGEKSFPDATFRFLMGADDLLGKRVFDLARSIPNSDFLGRSFVVAIQLAANFGRRPAELCDLRATRIRLTAPGAAELIYNNMKSKRNDVWLPIDADIVPVVEDWMAELQARWPDTPLDDLALLPSHTRNPDGTRSVGPATLGMYWRKWITLLEMAVVIGHLGRATGLDLQRLCGLRVGSHREKALVVDGVKHQLSESAHRVLVEYRNDLAIGFQGRMYVPEDFDTFPLFPDPGLVPTKSATPRGSQYLPTEYQTLLPARLEPLGEGWMELAAGYSCGGIPGTSLGSRRIAGSELQIRLMRHTYLQHLVDIGTPIYVVMELADHAHVQTTMTSYVHARAESLREAVENLAEHRLTILGAPASTALRLPSLTLLDVGHSDCVNPRVLSLGTQGCDRDRMCFGCEWMSVDPSHIPDIKAEIRTCNLSIARLEAEATPTELTPHHLEVLRARRTGWRRVLRILEEHLDSLSVEERERVETAAMVVREIRTRLRLGGVNVGDERLPDALGSS